tara:strand:+ start:278 stop:796 length:519 start_codon:yes stop_codon:yes gene_type:complete
MIAKKFLNKCKSIKLVITDVDGVLTDGGMYYSDKGEILKKFNTRDGMAVELLHKFSIKTIFLTSENSKIAKSRAKKVKADFCYINIKDKYELLPEICKKFHVKPDNIAYIGDDINDLKIMKHVSLSASPKDANENIRIISDLKCKKSGGSGVFREFADFILVNGYNHKTSTR